MESKKTIRELIYCEVWSFAVEEEYEEKLVKFMEENRVKFKKNDLLFLPKIGWFYTYEIWSAGDIGPSRYAVESRLKTLRNATEKKE